VTVRDRPEELRYEIEEDGEVAGFIVYRRDNGVITMLHTDVEPRREGEGVGSELVRGALDDVRARGLKVRPLCPFVAAFIKRHPAYDDLVEH
jgi:predicted GNAT family acetyltransferase